MAKAFRSAAVHHPAPAAALVVLHPLTKLACSVLSCCNSLYPETLITFSTQYQQYHPVWRRRAAWEVTCSITPVTTPCAASVRRQSFSSRKHHAPSNVVPSRLQSTQYQTGAAHDQSGKRLTTGPEFMTPRILCRSITLQAELLLSCVGKLTGKCACPSMAAIVRKPTKWR